MSEVKHEEMPGAVRKDLYEYLEGEGFKITDERHKAIRTAMILHTNLANVLDRKDRVNALNALGNMKATPAVKTMLQRIKDKQCPVCGLNLKELKPNEFESECGHYPKGVRIIVG